MLKVNREIITATLIRLLRPLVRLLLRNGVTYGRFSDLLRWVYVDVADREFTLKGRKQTASRVSVITGLNRKEVQRQRKFRPDSAGRFTRQYNRASRVIGGWLRDADFQDRTGAPRPLLVDNEPAGFALLVRRYSGDMPPRAILDELLAAGAAELDELGRVKLLARAYVPKGADGEKMTILGVDGADLIRTIDHNLVGASPAFFQRKVAYDNVPMEFVEQFRSLSAREGQQLLERLNCWLAERDRDSNPEVAGTGRRRIGMGIYYFEEDQDGDDQTEVS